MICFKILKKIFENCAINIHTGINKDYCTTVLGYTVVQINTTYKQSYLDIINWKLYIMFFHDLCRYAWYHLSSSIPKVIILPINSSQRKFADLVTFKYKKVTKGDIFLQSGILKCTIFLGSMPRTPEEEGLGAGIVHFRQSRHW